MMPQWISEMPLVNKLLHSVTVLWLLGVCIYYGFTISWFVAGTIFFLCCACFMVGMNVQLHRYSVFIRKMTKELEEILKIAKAKK